MEKTYPSDITKEQFEIIEPLLENKGYDAGKKVSGIKRHIAVDSQGLPHAIYVTTANITDKKG